MLKKIIFSLIISVLFFTFSYAADENITITTYYPSPYGSYRDLRITNNLTLQAEPINNDGPQIQWRTATTGYHWNIDQYQDSTGARLRFFVEDSNNLNGAERMTILENGTVGIGLSNPDSSEMALDVNGRIQARNGIGDIIELGGDALAGDYEVRLKPPVGSTKNQVDFYNTRTGSRADLKIRSIMLTGLGSNPTDASLEPSTESTEGTVYYNTTSDDLKLKTGSGWKTVGGTLSCTTVESPSTNDREQTATCPTGYIMTGGGARFDNGDSEPDLWSRPGTGSNPNDQYSWYCKQEDDRSLECYVRCCRIQ